MGRNADKRLRIVGIKVKLELGRPAAELEHLERVLAQFEEFCTVSMSVRQGIAIQVQVLDGAGTVLKG
jgi:organic hydroperoxide reductase OsmC/OhrA